MNYYSIPFSATELFKNKEFKKCEDLQHSIGDNIDLILQTSYGESAFDATFGCSIWEHDFECIYSTDVWNAKLGQSIKKSIQQYEPRLNNLTVSTNVVEDETTQQYNNTVVNRIKRRIDVQINGNIVMTNERFNGFSKLYISPISIY